MTEKGRVDALALHGTDNVATALRDLAAGEGVQIGGGVLAVAVRAIEPVPACHKIALADLAAGTRILKYGAVIGEATAAIPAGSHVHVHNIRSLRARG